GPSLRLRGAVRRQVAPAPDRLFVAPNRERQELAGFAQALEPLHRYETVDRLEFLHQRGGDLQIALALALGRPDLEDDGNHGFTRLAHDNASARNQTLPAPRLKPRPSLPLRRADRR